MRIVRALAVKNLEVRRGRWREDAEWNQIGGWSKVVVGSVVGLVSAGVLLNPPPEPVPEWEMQRKVSVTPPKGKGDVEVKIIQEAPAPSAAR